MNGNDTIIRVNVTLPKKLVSDLKKVSPKRGMSNFLAEAAKEIYKVIIKITDEDIPNPKGLDFIFES